MRSRALALALLGALAGCAQQVTQPPGEAPPEGAGPVARDLWEAHGCAGLSLVWTPPLERLREVVGPRWEPAPGPVPGRGLFVLFAVECPDSDLNRAATGPMRLGAAIVRLADPPEPPVEFDDRDGWSAVPEVIVPAASPVRAAFARNHFLALDGEPSVAIEDGPLGTQVAMAYPTPLGRTEATATVGGQPASRAVIGVLVGTDPERFSAFTGPETMTRFATGTAVVQAEGDTWVSRLGLEPRPFAVALDRDFQWWFEFYDHPWPG